MAKVWRSRVAGLPFGKAREKATGMLKENMGKRHELASYLLEKEIITGEEFIKILNRPQENAALSETGIGL